MSNQQKIHVSHLKVGMFISKLDRDWLETPFLLQGFMIEDSEDIDIVREYCEFVWIDTKYTPKKDDFDVNVGAFNQAPNSHYANKTTLEIEHQRAYKTFRRARSLTKSLMDDIRLGGALNTEVAKETVTDCIQSVLRHPDALLWMSKIRDEHEYTAEHSLNVCILAIAFGRQLDFDEEELHKLGLCGLLHDIGKLRIPNEIIDKPGKLNDKEMKIMMSHAVHGRNLLVSSPHVYDGAIDVAYSHHERIDGKGYPRQLPGSSISKYARIISIVDAFDAMTATRVYSKAMAATDALKIIYEERGKQFDEELAVKFIQTIGLFPVGSLVELRNGEVGFVIETNLKKRLLPRVILVLDENHEVRTREKVVDLSYVETGALPQSYSIRRALPDGTYNLFIREFQEKGLVLKH